jgi:cytoskeleton protein RodZ
MSSPGQQMAADRPAADFGARLRAAREGRGISLRSIADTTKISVRALEALERNDISQLPGGLFSRAFVRAYAAQVGLDPEQTIADFITRFPDDSVTQGHPRTRALVDAVERELRRKQPRLSPLRVALVAVPVLAAALYAGFSDRRPPAIVPGEPVAEAATRPAPAAARPAAELLVVEVDAVRPCRLTVAVDGGVGETFALEPGGGQRFTASAELSLTVSEPSAVRWRINGAPARPLTGPVLVTRSTVAALLATP